MATEILNMWLVLISVYSSRHAKNAQ